MTFDPPRRSEYIKEQKETRGMKVVGVFPAVYPRELLWAFNILPVEIWDPPWDIQEAHAHLQPSICSVVKAGLELVLRGPMDLVDGFLFPHTCDSIQNLASVVHDQLGITKPCHFLYHPKAPYGPSTKAYTVQGLKRLASELERNFGPLDGKKLADSVAMGQKISQAVRRLYDLRAQGKLKASGADFYRVVRQNEFLRPEDFLSLIQGFTASSEGVSPAGHRLVLSGVLPTPIEFLKLLDDSGARVADDDLLNCGRRLAPPRSTAQDPFEALAEMAMALPPCSTKGSPISERLNALLDQVAQSKAKAVIFYIVKFCEPEFFDVPQLRDGLKEKGIPSLVLECEVNQKPGGQMSTRVGAFLETLTS